MDITFGLRFISDSEAQLIALRGFKQTLQAIAANAQPFTRLTHKEVRATAKAALILLPSFDFSAEASAEIRFLLAGIASSGLNIADRATLARRALILIARHELKMRAADQENSYF